MTRAPQRGSRNRAAARRTSGAQAGPVGNRGIDVVDIGQMNLPVLAERSTRQAVAADPKLVHGNFGADAFRACAVMDDLAPFVALGNKDADAGGLEQPF